MPRQVDDYIAHLKRALAGADPATIQDALADAQEHLMTAFDLARKTEPAAHPAIVLEKIIHDYGTPEEVAMAYKEFEEKVQPALAPEPPGAEGKKSAAVQFFGVVVDLRAYGSLIYMFLALITGTIYFTWVVTGLSLSVGLIVLIIGFPIFVLFLLSVRGLAFIEGRLVEAILGVRMPRRPVFMRKDLEFWGRIKAVFADRSTWTAMLYLLLMLPLGVIYFTVYITLIAVSLSLIAMPVLEYGFNLPMIVTDGYRFYVDAWLMPFVVLLGFLLLIATMHLAKYTGRIHGKLAKLMLVKQD
jgi:uncharacterized membrane protein